MAALHADRTARASASVVPPDCLRAGAVEEFGGVIAIDRAEVAGREACLAAIAVDVAVDLRLADRIGSTRNSARQTH
jgi:hypothetical protein